MASHGEGSLGSLLTVPPHGAPGSDAKIAALEERIRNLEVLLAQLLADREQRRSKENAEPSEDQDEEVVVQAHHKWIEANRDTLREYIDSFVALDPDLGIVAHAPDGDELEAQLDSLSDEERSRVVVFHASMYFR